MNKSKKEEKHHSNFFGYLAHVFTDNIPLSLLVLFSAVFVGLVSYFITPKQYNPEVIRPAFVVVTEYPGADEKEVNDFVSLNIVNDVKGIKGVDEVFSKSVSGGLSYVTVLFDVGENEEDSKTKLFTKILEGKSYRKDGVKEPYIKSINPDDVPILTLSISSDKYDQNIIREKVFQKIDKLRSIEDVSKVEVFGGESKGLVILLDKNKMEALKVTLPEVLALRNANKRIIANDIKNSYRKISLQLDTLFTNKTDLENIYIKDGVQLSDIANISETYLSKEKFIKIDNKSKSSYQNIFIAFSKRKGSSAPVVSKRIQNEVEKIFKSNSSQSEFGIEVVSDDGEVANDAIYGLMVNLLVSVLIVGVVLYLFLSLKSAFVVMGAIPIILLLVFIPGFLAGHTINRITLFALILSLGLLVDSATVVVENIYRQIKRHPEKKVRENIVRAVNQVGVGLVLSTLTSVVVFIPVAFITGMMGPYIGPIAFFVPFTLVISLFIAFIITPFLAYTFFKKNKVEGKAHLDFIFLKLQNWYEKMLSKILSNRKLSKKILLYILLIFVLSLALPVFKLVHFQMLPKADKEQIFVYFDAPFGTDILETKKITEKISDKILENSNIKSNQIFIGHKPVADFNGMFKGVQNRNNSFQSTIRVSLKKERTVSSIVLAKQIRQALKEIKVPYKSVIKVLEDPPGPPVEATFVLEVYGDNIREIERMNKVIFEKVKKIKGLVDLDSTVEEGYEKNILSVNQEKLFKLGLSLDMVYSVVKTSTDFFNLSLYHNGKKDYADIQIGFKREDRKSLDDILSLSIPSKTGETVSLSEIVDIEKTRNKNSVYQKDGKTYLNITGEVENRSIVYVVLDTFSVLDSLNQEGFKSERTGLSSYKIKDKQGNIFNVKFDGEWDMTLNNFRDLMIAMGAALFLVYAILVAQYRSFLIPGLIMTTVPLGLVGILFGFTILDNGFNIYLTATALIGFIALIGIVVNNAILYLEYFTEILYEKPEMDHTDALIQAGRVRLRPILLTSITTVLANLTIVSDPVWSGLGWAVIFGLSLSTLMTLVVFPILYTYFNKK